MPLPISKTQLEKLGVRLASGDPVSDDDRAMFEDVLAFYGESLDRAAPRIGDATGYPATSRVKNTGTVLDKLRRNDGHGLKSMQDLAGARVVVGVTRDEQDRLATQLAHAFGDAPTPTRIIDRREEPSHGYRAVHVIVAPDGVPIEVQIRTLNQHRWAELSEKFADLVGRGVRYGEPSALELLLGEHAPRAIEAARIARSLTMLSDLVDIAERRPRDRFAPATDAMLNVSFRLAGRAVDDLGRSLRDAD